MSTIGNASIQYVLDATALQNVTPTFTESGNILLTTSSNGTDYVTFSSQACSQLTISNNTGTTIELQQGGSGDSFMIYPSTYYTLYGITDASSIGARRLDNSETQVNVIARWES